jgi:hypothetical protein
MRKPRLGRMWRRENRLHPLRAPALRKNSRLHPLPPGQTVDFLANDGLALVMTPESKQVPDLISVEIEAEWGEQ